MLPDSPAALSAAFEAAINERDVPAALELWSEDAAILSPDGSAVRGREAIAAALHALVDNGARVRIEIAELFAAGAVALATGTLTITGVDAAGKPYTQSSQSVVVYSRDGDGGWRVAIDAPWGLPSA